LIVGYNVFLATPKGMDAETVQRHYDTVVSKFTPALKGIELTVVKAEDDYREHFGRCGGWDAWARDVGQGVDYLARTPRYNGIVCVEQVVGKATASIVQYALEGNRMVVLLQPDGKAVRVAAVDTLDANNYVAGWILRLDN
jgi:hypothetical protein